MVFCRVARAFFFRSPFGVTRSRGNQNKAVTSPLSRIAGVGESVEGTPQRMLGWPLAAKEACLLGDVGAGAGRWSGYLVRSVPISPWRGWA